MNKTSVDMVNKILRGKVVKEVVPNEFDCGFNLIFHDGDSLIIGFSSCEGYLIYKNDIRSTTLDS